MSEFEFEVGEYEARLAAAQKLMHRERLDAILITSEDHFRYFTGFHSPTWVNLTRPRYAVLPSRGDIILIVPTSNTEMTRRTSWVRDVRMWVSPRPEDDGISLVRDAIRSVSGRHGRVGAELGPESRLTMPAGDFLRLGRELSPTELVDGYPLLRELMMRKSAAEIDKVNVIGYIASDAYEALPARIRAGMSIREACNTFRHELLERGAEASPYVIGVADRFGYPCFNLEPSSRKLSEGDVLVIDTGSTRHGYFCDFNREFSLGPLHEKLRQIYDIVWEATEVGIAATEPGRTMGEIWHDMSSAMHRASEAVGLPFEPFGLGRMGHGLGLRMCETPSIAPGVETVVETGMVLTIEPSMTYQIDVDGEMRSHVCVHEENVAVTADGIRLLNRRAPREMPVIG
ncbi:Xaa-Pro peptidase family protein [Mesorhizobium sp. 1M-11]|uniref:M24 family metallopeptidase n=1 Tax=Mesorhizobium sp. 1M-11 TaxID=1529006 RepID=UPI000A8E3B1F|nr:Xaa-Pro peptidase family protein [Mesorhizobium sp. 1M-11]